jgi:hypothetical protein
VSTPLLASLPEADRATAEQAITAIAAGLALVGMLAGRQPTCLTEEEYVVAAIDFGSRLVTKLKQNGIL